MGGKAQVIDMGQDGALVGVVEAAPVPMDAVQSEEEGDPSDDKERQQMATPGKEARGTRPGS